MDYVGDACYLGTRIALIFTSRATTFGRVFASPGDLGISNDAPEFSANEI